MFPSTSSPDVPPAGCALDPASAGGDESFGLLLHFVRQGMIHHLERVLAENDLGVNFTQYRALKQLTQSPCLSATELARRLARGTLRPCPESRAVFVRSRGGAWLCVDGRSHWLGGAAAPLAGLLSSGRPVRSAELSPWLSEPAGGALLLELVNAGAFEIDRRSLP